MYSKSQSIILIVLRIVIGYHFLYEGLSKFFNAGWSAAPFLYQANWLFADYFHFLANNDSILSVVNILNIWGQICIGVSLVIGLFSRVSAVLGAFMIALYYIVAPPFFNDAFFVNQNLLEFIGLLITVIFPTSKIFGLDSIVQRIKEK